MKSGASSEDKDGDGSLTPADSGYNEMEEADADTGASTAHGSAAVLSAPGSGANSSMVSGSAVASAPSIANASVPGSAVACATSASAAEKKKISGLLLASAISDITATSSASSNKESLGNEKNPSKQLLRLSRNNNYIPPENEETSTSKVKEDVSTVKPGLRIAPGLAIDEEVGDKRISLFGAIEKIDNLEVGPALIEAHLVPQEQDIPHAIVHTVDDKEELQQQEQREEEMKRRRGRMMFMAVLILLAVGAVLAISLSLRTPSQPSPTSAPTIMEVVTFASPGSVAVDAACKISFECSRSCCSESYSTSDGISKCIPVEVDNSTACIHGDSPSMSPVNDTPASTAGLPYVGSYWLTWGDGVNVQDDPNESFTIAFSGWNNISNALSDSEARYPNLRGEKYIEVGGGTESGRWSEDALLVLANATELGLLGSYDGILYSIILGDSGLVEHFLDSFALAKSNGLKVIVAVSYSAPNSITDGATLMAAFLNDSNIDAISPILFASGSETGNLYIETNGVSWSNYTNALPAIVPSLVQGGPYFTDAKNFFLKEYSIDIQGYIRWSQT